ncbi:MAG: argininosuccinate synthase [Candidatus Rokubacteria bacterium RIFCSPHIGHO2_12_FULL_73_22]|nr:MAG: argininosuccinate synthase [Candidatus Rokubacteria bacterium RIFCSPHIGHO2_02_FULL_73_26]OGL00738.1 MAG: argininosuccinate synthase [Candidatus Rokubacteria bacterium RIFCSPHIGHO2_12_FULL_73_22]OGL09380.1 MAG: argininosuccinate synthase [Candidatus Rokubacteria bacterium RIFCSPLOWO2_02_FULL_73_56]OGL29211.1 MAG: argininosuccinate synthase [Candidatus Rokubacteria bacterium RIFCSPLOWO2_12_FULL_73_47]
MTSSPKRVVLAYSGGLDTSVILRWLIERYGCEVVAFCADLGQGEELLPVREKALRTGAASVHVVDLRQEFVRDFIFPMLRANAVYEGAYLLGTSIARPLIARAQVEVAATEGADAVAHGATGKGNDQVRFELTYAALAPHLRVIAPWREWELDSRSALLEFARRHDIPVPVTVERPYSTDRNLFHISYEGGVLEDPWAEPPPKMFQLTTDPESAPDVPAQVEVEFERGDPVAVDGARLDPVTLLTRLNRLGGEHGVGRVDLVENRYVGMKSRGVYETPGGTILHVARRALESLTLDREVLHLRDSLVPRYAEMIYYGFWYAPERRILQALMDECQQDVTGTVRLGLYKGHVSVAGRRSPRSLYRTDFATFEADTVYRQRDAEGFINLNALRLKIRALRDRTP